MQQSRRGITILEMMVVVAIISLMAGLMYPSITSGLDGIKLGSASSEVAAFLNGATEHANRRNTPVEVTCLRAENAIVVRSLEPKYMHRYDLPQGIAMERILPPSPADPFAPRVFMIYPGGTMPRVGVLLATSQGKRRLVRIDPITGTPIVEVPVVP